MSFLGALGAVGRLLPGYMQGERQAIADNWNDLNQYNTFDENAMRDRLQMMRDNAMINNYQRWAAGFDLGVKAAQYPLMLGQLGMQAGHFFPVQHMKWNMLQQQAGMAMNPKQAAQAGQQGGALQQAMLGGLGGGWQYGLGGGYGYGGYGLGSRGGYGMMPSRY